MKAMIYDDNGTRKTNLKNNLAKVFSGINVNQIELNLDLSNQTVIFIHTGDISLKGDEPEEARQNISKMLENRKAVLVAYSSQGEASVTSVLKNIEFQKYQNQGRICIIGKPVDTSTQLEDELKKIQNNIKITESEITWIDPDCLIITKPLINISLSILCQGYLAVCKPETLQGWDTVKDLISPNLDSKKTTVQPLSWWRKPFAENEDEINGNDSEKLKQKAESLMVNIKSECGDQEIDKIEDLINAIYSNKPDQLIELEVVQNAYKQINEILPKFT